MKFFAHPSFAKVLYAVTAIALMQLGQYTDLSVFITEGPQGGAWLGCVIVTHGIKEMKQSPSNLIDMNSFH